MLGHVLIYLAGCLTCYLPLCTVYHWLFLLLCNLDRVGNILNMLLHHTMHARFEPIKWQSHFIFFLLIWWLHPDPPFLSSKYEIIFLWDQLFSLCLWFIVFCALYERIPPPTRQRGRILFVCAHLCTLNPWFSCFFIVHWPVRLVPYFQEAVPATCTHGHPILGDSQAGHTVVMPGQNTCSFCSQGVPHITVKVIVSRQ